FTTLRKVLSSVTDPRGVTIIEGMVATLTRMIDIGLPYLSMNRESPSLSGGEAQRLKLVRYMGSALTGMIYIFDEPSTGMHPRDVYRMTRLLKSLRDKGNTVLVVEHDKDVIRIADEIIDVGPLAGRGGGQILFQGSYEALLTSGTITGKAMEERIPLKAHPRVPLEFLPIRHASRHNLKDVSVDIPLDVLTVVTGVAGSGKSTLIREIFAKTYRDRVVLVDQSPITATGRSTPATYLGFFDEIRKQLAKASGQPASLFSFNSKGACPVCKGKGIVVTELVFMDPVTTVCEACEGKRYSDEALSQSYRGKNIVDILSMTVEEAQDFFQESGKITKHLNAMAAVGLGYLSLGQPLSTLSGGESQRLKLAKNLDKKGNIYILDEPTTGLHAKDVRKIMGLLDGFVVKGNTVIVIEHNLDVMKQADYLIDIGPDGGTAGGQVVFTGSPAVMAAQGETITAKYLRDSLIN
ncbi:MAG: ATP-binding cassette domain-containing protein, partial [Eubacterium sp.]